MGDATMCAADEQTWADILIVLLALPLLLPILSVVLILEWEPSGNVRATIG